MNTEQNQKKHSRLRHIAAICVAASVLFGGTVYTVSAGQTADPAAMETEIPEAYASFTVTAGTPVYVPGPNNIPSGWPVESRIVSTEFNPTADRSIGDGRKHEGMDISTRSQIIPISAAAEGMVVTANYHKEYGNQVIIDHLNGFTTLYAHCDELMVQEGDFVKKGDLIATTGNTGWSTGVHLHYEVMLDGEYQNPREYL